MRTHKTPLRCSFFGSSLDIEEWTKDDSLIVIETTRKRTTLVYDGLPNPPPDYDNTKDLIAWRMKGNLINVFRGDGVVDYDLPTDLSESDRAELLVMIWETSTKAYEGLKPTSHRLDRLGWKLMNTELILLGPIEFRAEIIEDNLTTG